MTRGGILCCVAALALAPPAWAGPAGDAARARSGLDRAAASGSIAAFEAEEWKRVATDAAATSARLGGSRGANLAGALATVAAQSGSYDRARAVTLFEMLRFNTQQLSAGEMPARDTDRRDADGVVYRAVPGLGFQFHPLASFGKLNAEVTAGRDAAAARLAWALLARARPVRAASLEWETYYRTSGGRPPWTSGMTQAVAAQALARAGFLPFARQAFAPVRARLLHGLPQGPWIRHFHFGGDLVLNSQLQAALSIAEYGRIAGDPAATALAGRMRGAALALLPRFDTGEWTRYALGGGDAEITYHGYVASLLWKLQAATGNAEWGRWAATFRDYWRAPPEIRPGPESPPALPVPADGFRDEAEIRFWLSKPATVTLRIAGEARAQWFPAGDARLSWSPGTRPPGEYTVLLSAVDRAGNRSERKLPPVRVERDNEPPQLETVALDGEALSWQARDPQSPWVELRLVLRRGAEAREVELGRRTHSGSVAVDLPPKSWHATLVAADSAGNRAAAVVGTLNRPVRYAE